MRAMSIYHTASKVCTFSLVVSVSENRQNGLSDERVAGGNAPQNCWARVARLSKFLLGYGAEPWSKLNLAHFICKIWHLVTASFATFVASRQHLEWYGAGNCNAPSKCGLSPPTEFLQNSNLHLNLGAQVTLPRPLIKKNLRGHVWTVPGNMKAKFEVGSFNRFGVTSI